MWTLLAATAAAASFTFADADGSVGFHAVSSLHEFDGAARTFQGTFDPASGKGQVVVGVAGLTTGIGARDSRMVYTCFDAAQWPELRFTVASVEDPAGVLVAGQGHGNVVVQGTLRIRDVDEDFTIPAEVVWEGANLRVRGAFSVVWADYGIPDPSILISKLRPDVTVRFDLVGKPQ